ncbi:MAG: PAS domain-containing protein [Calothrix sp. SM1_5_4]|nr:PAS domain-containing protein [Calothrix sp. SM1_5_4]
MRQKTIRLSREKTELRAIMSAVSEAVLAIDKERRVLFFNSQFALLFNFQGQAAEARITGILRAPDVLEAYDNALKTGVVTRREVQLSVSNERLPRHFQLSVAPLKKKHNQEIYGAVGILHDITELKQAERIRIDFVGNVSHELRTPLTVINGYLQTLTADIQQGATNRPRSSFASSAIMPDGSRISWKICWIFPPLSPERSSIPRRSTWRKSPSPSCAK